jgi:hypothetical protein
VTALTSSQADLYNAEHYDARGPWTLEIQLRDLESFERKRLAKKISDDFRYRLALLELGPIAVDVDIDDGGINERDKPTSQTFSQISNSRDT